MTNFISYQIYWHMTSPTKKHICICKFCKFTARIIIGNLQRGANIAVALSFSWQGGRPTERRCGVPRRVGALRVGPYPAENESSRQYRFDIDKFVDTGCRIDSDMSPKLVSIRCRNDNFRCRFSKDIVLLSTSIWGIWGTYRCRFDILYRRICRYRIDIASTNHFWLGWDWGQK